MKRKQKTSAGCNMACSQCAGLHRTPACPLGPPPKLKQGQKVWHLWPPAPKAESWCSDVPNEGLLIIAADDNMGGEGSIVDSFADYHGLFIINPNANEAAKHCSGLRPCFAPVQASDHAEQYLAAYRQILLACAPNWHNPPQGNWPAIARDIVQRLLALGWREVTNREANDGRYWHWK